MQKNKRQENFWGRRRRVQPNKSVGNVNTELPAREINPFPTFIDERVPSAPIFPLTISSTCCNFASMGSECSRNGNPFLSTRTRAYPRTKITRRIQFLILRSIQTRSSIQILKQF